MKYKDLKKIHVPKDQGVGLLLAGYYMGRIVKPLTLPLLRILVHTRITGNQVTFSMFLLGIIGSFFVGFPKLTLIGCIILQATIFLDTLDGSLARYRNQKSVYGRYLDAMFHNLTIPLLFFMSGVYSYNYFGNTIYIFMGVATAFLIFSINVAFLNKYFFLVTETKKMPSSLKKDWKLVTKFRKNLLQKIVGQVIISLNRFPNIFTLFLIAKIFNFLQYLIFIYFPFYFLVAMVKIPSDFKSAKKELG